MCYVAISIFNTVISYWPMSLRNRRLPYRTASATSALANPNPTPREGASGAGAGQLAPQFGGTAAEVPCKSRRRRFSCARDLERRHAQAAARERPSCREEHACTADRAPHYRGRSVGRRYRRPARRWAHGCIRRPVRAPLPYRGQASRLAVGPGGGFGYGAAGALGNAGAAGAPPVAHGQAAPDGSGTPGLGPALYGDRSAANPLSTLGCHVNKIMASRAVVS